MDSQQTLNYQRIAAAISFLESHFQTQPELEEVAAHVHLSPYHFQRLFTEWAGVSPKKFLQFISTQHAKNLLKTHQASIFDATFETGLSNTSRLHDLFVQIEGMTPGEYKNGGKNISINYSFSDSPFGEVLVATTSRGICHMAFTDDRQAAFEALKNQFPQASFHPAKDIFQENAIKIFNKDQNNLPLMKLHLRGTPFQLKVWESLLKIPMGQLTTYGEIASHIQHPRAARAVGTAIGQNPVAFLIPCHRVIQATGTFGGYMWGKTRKTAIIGWESALIQN
ncbi:MAG: methylated-DNA--[protein]-cysteine S-methyltransferase [Bacteroidia bacterium]